MIPKLCFIGTYVSPSVQMKTDAYGSATRLHDKLNPVANILA